MIRKIKLQLYTLIILTSIIGCNESQPGINHQADNETYNLFFNRIESLMGDLQIDKYALALVDHNDIVFLKEVGIGIEDQVEIGNLSNMLVAATVMELKQEELVNMKSRVSDYGVRDERVKNENCRALLSHTSQNSLSQYKYDQPAFNNLFDVIENVTEKNASKTINSAIRKYGMKNTSFGDPENSCTSTLLDLAIYSSAIDNQNLFKDESLQEELFRPVYLESGERTPTAPGSFIDLLINNKYIWSFGTGENYSSFFLKSKTDSLTLLLVTENNNLHMPFNMESGKLWNSPVATNFLKFISFSNDTLGTVDYSAPVDQLEENLKQAKQFSYKSFVVNEMIQYMKMYKKLGMDDQFEKLKELYENVFPEEIPLELFIQEPLVEIQGAVDYAHSQRKFSLNKDTSLQVFAVGEFTTEMLMVVWEYDNIEVFLDLSNGKSGSYDNDDRQIRFNYDSPNITGNYPSSEGMLFKQYDISEDRYAFEIILPWETLGDSVIITGKEMGFDLAIADNDGESTREGSLAWNSDTGEQPWQNTSVFGTMILVESVKSSSPDSICYSVRRKSGIQLDGKNTGDWNRIPRYAIEKDYILGVEGKEDLSAWFQSQWDEENLYLLVEVRDDHKRKLDVTGDYGWIENEKGDTAWLMTEYNTMHAGGAESNRFVNTAVSLEKGDYTLYYITNQTNSPSLWIYEEPELSFYGIALFN